MKSISDPTHGLCHPNWPAYPKSRTNARSVIQSIFERDKDGFAVDNNAMRVRVSNGTGDQQPTIAASAGTR